MSYKLGLNKKGKVYKLGLEKYNRKKLLEKILKFDIKKYQ